MLANVTQYRTFTGDITTSSDAITAAIEESTSVWEDYLDRWLLNAEYSENVNTDKRGRVFPKAVPVTEAPSGYTSWAGGYELIGAAPTFPPGYWPTWEDPLSVDITYTGGFTNDTCPRVIRENVIKSAHKVLHPDTSTPSGITSAKLGDAAVTYGEPTSAYSIIDKAQEKKMRGYMRRHI